MKTFKFNVQIINEDGTVKETKNFKSVKDIEKAYNIEYHQIRSILGYNKNPKKFYHNFTMELLKKIRITEIKPNLNL